ncbi:hypothetical protein D3C79_1054360 [compost metagenome]
MKSTQTSADGVSLITAQNIHTHSSRVMTIVAENIFAMNAESAGMGLRRHKTFSSMEMY